MINIRPEVLEVFKRYIEENPEEASFDPIKTEKYHKFLELFPIESLKTISLQEYCLGEKEKYPDNFCWWLEHNLGDILGGYFAGNSYSHLIYWSQTEQKYNKSPKLKAYNDLDAMQQVGRLNYIIASVYPENNIDLLDSNIKLAELADTVEGLQLGLSRKLRITQAYYPSYFPTINSIDVIENYLKALGAVADETKRLVSAGKIYHLADILRQYYLEITKLLNIKDSLTINGFAKMWYLDEYKSALMNGIGSTDQKIISSIEYPLNQVLYGPPGTGKTYKTVEKAVEICDPDFLGSIKNKDGDIFDRDGLKARYDELIESKQISFVTFHQSFSYEDFVEGIRATTNDDGQIEYSVEDGIFKEICNLAQVKEIQRSNDVIENVEDKIIWKMSLGDTQDSSDAYIFDECISNNYILLGFGFDLDYSNNSDYMSIEDKYHTEKQSAISMVHSFVNEMKIGDLIIVTDGNHKFRAIAEITGNYYLLDDQSRNNYRQARKVKWLREFSSSLPVEQISKVNFMQRTIYKIKKQNLKLDQFIEYITPSKIIDNSKKNFVLIIDEINRGNIANIFGELITLLEPSKRAGNDDARSVTLPYSKEQFSVPNNLYIIGTMNTSDHSLTKLDLALRRRFEFVELLPDYSLINDIKVYSINIGEILETINDRIEILLGRDYLIGHSYFLPLKDSDNKENMLSDIFKNKIIPLLQEYFFEDWERIQWVLNDQNKPKEIQFIHMPNDNKDIERLFKKVDGLSLTNRRYKINKDAFSCAEAYQQILNVKEPE